VTQEEVSLPANEHAEEQFLSAMISNESHCIYGLSLLSQGGREMFYGFKNSIIAGAILEMSRTQPTISPGSLGDYLSELTLVIEGETKSQLEIVGGRKWLMEFAFKAESIINMEALWGKICEKWTYRQLMMLGGNISGLGKEQYGSTADEAVHRAIEELTKCSGAGKPRNPFVRADGLTGGVLEEIVLTRELDGALRGAGSGFRDLDNMLLGFQPGQFIVLGARPAMGKTSMALCIAANVALDQGLPALFFSLEMSKLELGQKLLSLVSGVPLYSIRKGMLSENDWLAIADASKRIEEAPLYIDENSSLTTTDIKAKVLEFQHKVGNPGLVIVDYMQLMASDGPSENRQVEVSTMSRELKVMASTLGFPMLALSQLNRGLGSRQNKRPQLADLRESGSIEQDANVVMFLYRDEIYHPASAHQGMAEVIVSKNRSGDTGVIHMRFSGERSMFADIALPVPQEAF